MMRESSGGVRMRVGARRLRSLNPRRGIAPDAALVHREVQEQPTELQSFQPLGPAASVHHAKRPHPLGLGSSETAGSTIEPSVNRGGWPPTLGASGTNQQRGGPCQATVSVPVPPRHLDPPSKLLTRRPHRHRIVSRSAHGAKRARAPGVPLRDAVLDAMRGALRILGGMVQMAAGMTRLLAVAVLKAATAADKAVEASEEDEET
jgi:hypothetical protein